MSTPELSSSETVYESGSALTDTVKSAATPVSDFYDILQSNWYKSLPYGFAFPAKGSSMNKIWLPISPSNLDIKTHFATNIVTTLYAVVEEHSEIRYYDITISGTTGIAPQYIGSKNTVGNTVPQSANSILTGRSSFESETLVNLKGFLPEVTNAISQIKDTINSAFNPSGNPTGVQDSQTGYMAFHTLYQFFLEYKKDTATSKTRTISRPMQFLNYKDNNKYDCVPIDFQLSRSKDSPMLYNYRIQLRAYNLRNVYADDNIGDLDSNLVKLGLDGIDSQSIFSELSEKAADAAALISAVF